MIIYTKCITIQAKNITLVAHYIRIFKVYVNMLKKRILYMQREEYQYIT